MAVRDDQASRSAFCEQVMAVFRMAKFNLSDSLGTAAFDFFAEKPGQGTIIVTKTCTKLDSFKHRHGIELRLISELVSASPVLVAKQNLKDDAIYSRYGIPGVNLATLSSTLNQGILPKIISKRGGFYQRIKGEEIPGDELSLGRIARECGVTTKTLRYWKEGRSLPTPERLENLARALKRDKNDLVKCVDPFNISISVEQDIHGSTDKFFQPKGNLQHEIDEVLREIDIKAKWLHSAPFDAICTGSQERKSSIIPIVTGAGVETPESQKRLKMTASIIKITKKRGLWISEDQESLHYKTGIPVLSLAELEKIRRPGDLERTIRRKIKNTDTD